MRHLGSLSPQELRFFLPSLPKGDAIGTYQLVELRVLSNWGHPEYTCIYRFRVHGEPVH